MNIIEEDHSLGSHEHIQNMSQAQISINNSLLHLPDLNMNSDRKGGQSKRLSNQGLSSHNSFSVDEQAKKADPFKKPLIMRIYECGDILTNLFQPYVEIDLN
jgi:hypothetical protein